MNDLAAEVYRLADAGERSATETVDNLVALRQWLRKGDELLQKTVESKSNTVASFAAIKHLAAQRVIAATKLAKLASVGLLAMLCMGGDVRKSAARTTDSVPEPAPRECAPPAAGGLDAACAALRRGDHAGAAPLFRRAADSGCDPDVCLSRLAECQYRLGRFDAALATCDELEARVPASPWPPFVRGLVFKKLGDVPRARFYFDVAAVRGHPAAAAQLRLTK